MPLLSLPTRRSFLAASAGAAWPADSPTVRWAFLSDTHIAASPADEYRGFNPYNNLRKVVEEVLAWAPAGVIIDGDLARLEGLPGDYHNLKSLLAPLAERVPMAMALGNHDHRENFLTVFRDDPGERHYVKGKYILSLEAGPVRFLLLDSLIRANYTPGLLGKAQRDWLTEFLRTAAPKPTVVFVHHTLDDGDNSLLDVLWLFRILERHRMVKAVVYGHSHVYSHGAWGDIQLVNLPAVGYNFWDRSPVGWVEATLTLNGADLRLRALGGNMEDNGKVTSIRWSA